MKKIILSFLFSASALVIIAQNVLTIDDQNISLDEFKNIFYKNNNNIEFTKEYLDEYMNLFVNFKLKVKEAYDLNLDTILAFKTELDGYKKQLAKPYLKNKKFDNNMLSEAYERMKQDIKVSHILIALDETSSIQKEKLAYDKILSIRSSILDSSISFETAAKNNSDDKSALANGGDLSYFTAFMMVYNFESAAYSTKIGEISMPIRTKYGYHIISVTDKRKASGEVKVAHIMFKSGEGSDNNKINEAKDNIYKIAELLKNGEVFSDVAERFSEDRSTAVKGGNLPAFGVGKMVPEFELAAFGLKEIGEVSSPFRTQYGWHIITLLERKGIPSFEEIKSELKRKIESDSRGELSKVALYAKLRKTYKVKNNPQVYTAFRKNSANAIALGKFKSFSKGNSKLVTINGKSIYVSSFINFILINQKLGSNIDNMYLDFVNEELLIYEESQLEIKYPEYKALLQEYREGILLFDLTNAKVWNKAVEDTVGLQSFYNSNINNYKWEERVDASIYRCIDLVTAKTVKRAIHKKHRGNINNAEILIKANEGAPLSLQINSKKFVKGENKYIDSINWKVGISKDIKTSDGSYIIIDINEVLEPRSKTLNENRGKVISDYQNILEKEWIVLLKEKYKVKVNKDVLYKLIKQ
jgi:peptidyl-prolyl cis-trans isomerase SurA